MKKITLYINIWIINHESMYQTWIHQCTSLQRRPEWRRRRMTWLAVFEEKEWLALQRCYLIQNSTNYLHIRSVLLVTKSESYSQQWAGGSGHLLWDLTQWEPCIALPPLLHLSTLETPTNFNLTQKHLMIKERQDSLWKLRQSKTIKTRIKTSKMT